jgi:Calcineurin-like phosphoesterase
MPLATLIQISDLHLGRLDKKSIEARTAFWKRWPFFNGILGHSADSLSDLMDFFDEKLREDPQPHLVVTGDLTAVGAPAEFDIADQYLSGILRDHQGHLVGLNVRDWRDRAIPGNHDSWPGLPIIIGRPTHALGRYFPKLPGDNSMIRLDNEHQIRLLRIDTDSDVNPFFSKRLKAIGDFESQLKSLARMLNVNGPNDDEIRVLCLHHSPSWRDSILEITKESRRALRQFIEKYNVAVLLCGHIHRPPWATPFIANFSPPSALAVLEGCCGTTTQKDPSIGMDPDLEDLFRPGWENSLYVHRLSDFKGGILWEAELYLEGRGGFVRADRLRPNLNPITRMMVWPWPPHQV